MKEKLGELTMSLCRVQQDLLEEHATSVEMKVIFQENVLKEVEAVVVQVVPELVASAVRKVTCLENAQLVEVVAEAAPIELATNVVRKATYLEIAQPVEEVALSREVL